jgi:two-component system, LytTR family, response regulator
MTPLRVLIVDDEPLARGILREMLADRADIAIAGECGDGLSAVKALQELQPDLLLLDVQMPKLDGFEVLELIGTGIPVIFVTAFDSYAMRAFEVHAVDYLLKPFTQERLDTAIERARQRLSQDRTVTGAELATAGRGPAAYAKRIVARDGVRVYIIPVEKLDYVEAQEDYIALHTEGKSILKQQTMSSMEAALDPKRFVRVHRGFLVNIERIARVEPYTANSRIVVLHGGQQLPVSRTGYARLEEVLGK